MKNGQVIFGVWRSWLAHLHGVQGVVCSSQITPTKKKGANYLPLLFSYYIMYNTYILYSPRIKRIYTGHTEDIERRLEEHNRGKTSFSAKGKPWQIVFSKAFSSRADAIKLEKFIKKRGAARFLNDNNITVGQCITQGVRVVPLCGITLTKLKTHPLTRVGFFYQIKVLILSP
jgi:putative endonuclease